MIFDHFQDLYSPGGPPTLDGFGFFAGQSLIADSFQPEAMPLQPVYHDMFIVVGIFVCYRLSL